jgi:glutamine amidotransferase
MQLFADRGLEEGEREGFGWIPGRVVRIDIPGARVPHIGWSPVEPSEAESGRPDSIFSGVRYGHFYFMHGYHFLPDDPSATIALTPLGEGRLVSALRRDNLVGVQFHPEKSQGDGLRVLRNIVEGFRR